MAKYKILKYSLSWSYVENRGDISISYERPDGSIRAQEIGISNPSNFLIISQMLRHEERVVYDTETKQFESKVDEVGG